MRNRLLPALLSLLGLAALAAAEEVPPRQRPPIYDVKADAAPQIAVALATAQREQKRVLLQFGANWCIWCHRLHALMHDNADLRTALQRDFVLVLVDVDKLPDGTKHNAATNAKYGDAAALGLPALVVLDSDGKLLTKQETGALEDGKGHSPAKVLAFLGEWSPNR